MKEFNEISHNFTSSIVDFKCFIFSLFAYLVLALGGIGFGQDFSLIRVLVIPLWFLALFLIFVAINSKFLVLPRVIIFLYIFLSLYILTQFFRTENINLAIQKIDGFLFSGFFVFIIWRYSFLKYHNQFLRYYIYSSIFILFLTFIYRLVFDDDRFFLNGPNVFGWMMALAAILSAHLYNSESKRFYFVYLGVFLIGIIWTGSKGAMIGALSGLSLYLLFYGYVFKFIFSICIFFFIASIAYIYDFVPENYQIIFRLILGTEGDLEFGSIGIRQLMYADGIKIFTENSFFGVGIGNWDSFSSIFLYYGEKAYPHNILIEVLAEYGLLGLLIFLIAFIIIFIYTSKLGNIIMLMFIITLMFSGDMAYWRFIMWLPIAFIPIYESNLGD